MTRFHCDDAIFRRLVKDQLPSHEEREVTSHIERCADCQAKLEAVSESDISWSDVRRFLSPQAIETSNLASSTAGPGQTPTNTAERPMEFLAPSDRPNSLGRFGRYEITEILGRGGMGVVMRGYDPALDRHSAIKVLAPELATNAAARNRFAREAKSAAAVVHEHVVPIQTVDEERGLPYLMMPVVEGPSLEQRVAQTGPLPVVEILRIGMQTASGLAAAHEQGLVHRDVKPANILLENGVERVMITDFGLARAVDDASMTRSGVIAGTPQYMSPEQARGNDVEHRSDLFSLGSVLYFMCTGRSPFRADTMMGVLNRITNDTPRPIRKINPDIPEWLCQIIAKLMSKQPDDRFASAREVAELLEECLAHVQQPTAVPLPASLATQSNGSRFFSISRRSAGVIAMIAAFGFSLLGMVLWQATTPPDIAGKWTGEEWGTVVLEEKHPGKYEGHYTGTTADEPGSIQVKWSRLEGRFNGAWKEGGDRSGKISLRLVDDEIRGAWTTTRKSDAKPGTPKLADLLWTRAAKTRLANRRMRVLGANGRPVADNAVIRGTEGYSGPNLPALSETPSHLGMISLGKLEAGTHWFLVDFSTVLRIELPAAEEIIEPSLPQFPSLIAKNLDVKVAVEVKDNVELIVIQIHNRTAETIQITEANLQLMTAIKGLCADARVLSPLWSKAADGEALAETTIAPDQTATLRLNWDDWVKHGFWFSRDSEVLAEPSFPELEDGRTWVRVTLGSARPVSVTHPDKIVGGGDDNRVSSASGETRVPGNQATAPAPESAPDPLIDNPSAESTSEPDRQDLHVADDTCFAAIRLPNTVTNPNHWRWKVHIPKNRRCELRFSAYDAPIDGIAKGEFAASEHRSQGQPITTHGEVVIEFAAFPNATGAWQYGVSVNGATLFSGGFNTFRPETKRDTSLSVGKATKAWSDGVHPVLLLAKYTGADVQRLGSVRPDSCRGFAVWIRDLKILGNEGVVIGSKPDCVFLAGISQQGNTGTAWFTERGGKGMTKVPIGEVLKVGDVSAVVERMEERAVLLKVNGKLLRWKLGMNFADLLRQKEALEKEQDITPAPESVPDPQIDNPSDEPTSEQDDRQALIVVDSADYSDTEFMMRMVELERNAKTSKLRLTYKKRSSAVGSSMFMMWGLYEVAKARGTEYFICLDGSSDRQNETVFIAGFTNTKDADIQEIFGELYSHTEIDGQKRKYWSVSEWEFFSRSVSWSPPNDDSQAKAEIAAIRLAVEEQGTPSQKHAVLTEAFAKSDSPHVKMRILQMAKVVKAPEFEPFLLSVLQDKTDVRDRILAVMALAQHGSAASIEPLLDCAENDPEGEAGAGCMRCRTTARQDAYLALAEIGLRHPAERDRIAAAVAAIPVTTNDVRDPKAQALYILTQDQKLLKPFLDRLRDEDPETRKLGVRALRPFKLSYAPEQLVKLLADSNPDIQADTARLLGTIGDPKTIPVLIEAATATDGDRHARANAIRAIGSMRVKEAEPVMRKLLSDESVEVTAAIALFQITGERHPLVPEGYNLE